MLINMTCSWYLTFLDNKFIAVNTTKSLLHGLTFQCELGRENDKQMNIWMYYAVSGTGIQGKIYILTTPFPTKPRRYLLSNWDYKNERCTWIWHCARNCCMWHTWSPGPLQVWTNIKNTKKQHCKNTATENLRVGSFVHSLPKMAAKVK